MLVVFFVLFMPVVYLLSATPAFWLIAKYDQCCWADSQKFPTPAILAFYSPMLWVIQKSDGMQSLSNWEWALMDEFVGPVMDHAED